MAPQPPKSDLITEIKGIIATVKTMKDAEDSSREALYRISQGNYDLSQLTPQDLEALGVTPDILTQAQSVFSQYESFLQNTRDDRYRIY